MSERRPCGNKCHCEKRSSTSQACMYDHLGRLLPHPNTGHPDTYGESQRKREVGVCRSCCKAWPCERAVPGFSTAPQDSEHFHTGPVPNVGHPALLDCDDEVIAHLTYARTGGQR